jgi:hypothetical protein
MATTAGLRDASALPSTPCWSGRMGLILFQRWLLWLLWRIRRALRGVDGFDVIANLALSVAPLTSETGDGSDGTRPLQNMPAEAGRKGLADHARSPERHRRPET